MFDVVSHKKTKKKSKSTHLVKGRPPEEHADHELIITNLRGIRTRLCDLCFIGTDGSTSLRQRLTLHRLR